MAGITHLSSYIPSFRISKKLIAEAWSTRMEKGTLSVANFDEDTITMAVEAGSSTYFPEQVNSITLATTSSPFREESAAAFVSYILGNNQQSRAIDISQSLTGGLDSIIQSYESNVNNSMVIASDRRKVESGGALETEVGEAASAISIGNKDVLLNIQGYEGIYDFGYEPWMLEKQEHLLQADEKFSAEIREKFYIEVAEKILNNAGISIEEIDRIIVADRQEKMGNRVKKRLGYKKEIEPSRIYKEVGYTGVSMPLLLLNEELYKVNPGDRILLLQSGSGVKGILFQVTDKVKTFQFEDTLMKQLDSTIELGHYNDLLLKRGKANRTKLKPYSTLTYLRRERASNLQLKAQQCPTCQTIHFPKQQLCRECKSILPSPDYLLSKEGKVFTFTKDHVFPGHGFSMIMTVIDLKEGVRIFTQLTDSEHVEIDMPVKLSFRKVHEGSDYPNYFWKAIPALRRRDG